MYHKSIRCKHVITNYFHSVFVSKTLGEGKKELANQYLRTLVFQVIMVLTLPIWFGINGIWSAISVAEALTLIMTITFFIRQKDRYQLLLHAQVSKNVSHKCPLCLKGKHF